MSNVKSSGNVFMSGGAANNNPFQKNTTSITDLVLHKSSSSIEKLDDNFCGAFQEHYEYLMDKGLIETCQVCLIKIHIFLSLFSSI